MTQLFTPSAAFRALLLLTALILPACAGPDTKSLQDGFKLYTDQHPDRSEAIADRFIAASPDAPEVDQAYYLRGISRMTRNNLLAASADLKTAIGKSSRADLRGKSYRALGDMAFDQQRWSEAFTNYQSALDSHGLDASATDYINYRIGAVLQAQGDWTRAKPYFAKVVDAHLDTTRTDRARHRMGASAFSLQFGAFQELNAAQTLAAQIRAAGIAAAVISDIRPDNKTLYLVQSGNYPNFGQATIARDRILPRFPLAVIVP